MIYYIIAALIIILDQITKWIVATQMEISQKIPLIDGFLYFTSHRNTGAAFGILEGQMWFFYIVTIGVVIAIVYFMQKEGRYSKLYGTSLALILGGAIGNFIDRLFRGEVVDFIDTYPFGYNFAIFNVADSALCIGVALLFIKMFQDERKAKKEIK
ncbi:peptidase A8 [Alkalihalobacillus alcalophilus ATCC 27647 = CGMCC 1.3604]|uniref:Lipoprotein signal peptidase n=1 Tax=Alkalihalobacillus alcalophilus ATCC 27647 = CGMCC 1.3604 TaxID=1218173 RepID=A0A094YW87_ALKAL|nr:signal peptidase II [Alkalihalobacillus alcalophilus]KGA97762.1 peptidase A8 [Alkalihalobacillus alcalophilus ATCC 27647 = CGMCC 1.3604]MED1563130.1 signal peptidase II [Alkalihalobacillus alcalophilus]THG89248.1 peptidase A8 [Alkalihalobacillus alcalophilus ATCC 27647 = CGMCC 1.3604]